MIICFPLDKSQKTNCFKLCFKWVESENDKERKIAVGLSGVYSCKAILGGVWSTLFETLTLSETKIGDFPKPV